MAKLKENNAVLLLLLPVALSLLFVHNRMTDLSEDGACYWLLAKSLWSGSGYRWAWVEGAPAHTQFPPLLPFLLAPLWSFVGIRFWVAHFFMALCHISAGWVGYRFLRKRFSPVAAALWAVFIITSPLYLEGVASVGSEYPYTILSLLGLLLLEVESITPKKWIGALLLFALAYYARTIGVALFLAAALLCIVRSGESGRWVKSAVVVGSSVILMLPWILWTRATEGQKTYVGAFFIKDPYSELPMMVDAQDMARRIGSNFLFYVGELPSLITFELMKVRIYFPALFFVAVVAMTAVIFIGWWRWICARRSVAPVYFLIYFGPLMLWPWQYARFLFPVLILAGICLCDGFLIIGGKIFGDQKRGRIEGVLALLAAILILGNIAGIIRHKMQPMPPQIANFYSINESLKERALPSDIVVSRNPAVTSLITGLKVRGFAGAITPGVAMDTMTDAQWTIIGELDLEARNSFNNLMEHYPARFLLVAEKGDTRLYRILPETLSPPSTRP